MDRPQEHKEIDSEHQPDEARTLVAALTNLLLNDPTPPTTRPEDQSRTQHQNLAPGRTSTADASLRNFTSTSSDNNSFLDEEGQTGQTPFPPAFLADSHQVREALRRADSLRPRGHLDDEPFSPSAFIRDQPRFRNEGE
jgi:hypothetical protein